MSKCNHEDLFSTVLGLTCLDCGLIIHPHPGKEEAVGFANALIIAANRGLVVRKQVELSDISLQDWLDGKCQIYQRNTMGVPRPILRIEILPQIPGSPNMEKYARVWEYWPDINRVTNGVWSSWDEFVVEYT